MIKVLLKPLNRGWIIVWFGWSSHITFIRVSEIFMKVIIEASLQKKSCMLVLCTMYQNNRYFRIVLVTSFIICMPSANQPCTDISHVNNAATVIAKIMNKCINVHFYPVLNVADAETTNYSRTAYISYLIKSQQWDDWNSKFKCGEVSPNPCSFLELWSLLYSWERGSDLCVCISKLYKSSIWIK